MEKVKREKLFAAGKINLYLNVKKVLRDDGYHEIKSIMQSISLYDELDFEVKPRSDKKNGQDEGNGIYITSNEIDLPLGDKNHVHKAALIVLERFGLKDKYDININIHKSIPVSAGLAGGSTNAAATLIALERIFDLDIKRDELLHMSEKVGSDVPFCLFGGTVLAEGKGEMLTKLPDIPFYWVIIASNGKKFLTGDVYEKFDLSGKERPSRHLELIDNLDKKDFDAFFSKMENDLETVVIDEDNMIRGIKEAALEAGAFATQMTGSGPTVFAFSKDLRTARKIRDKLTRISSRIFLAHTTPYSLSFVNDR